MTRNWTRRVEDLGESPHKLLISVTLFISALIILDQVVRFRVIWQWDQVLHHENFVLILISFMLGILLSQKLSKEGKASH